LEKNNQRPFSRSKKKQGLKETREFQRKMGEEESAPETKITVGFGDIKG